MPFYRCWRTILFPSLLFILVLMWCRQFREPASRAEFVYSNPRVGRLIQELRKSEGTSPDSYSDWEPDSLLLSELITQLVRTSDAEDRYAIEGAINIITGSTKEQHEKSRTALRLLLNDADIQVQAVALFMLSPGMLENSHDDEGNVVRLQFCRSDTEPVRWLAVRDLSMVGRNYIVESDNYLLFLNVKETKEQAIAALKDLLQSDPSAAVRFTSLDGLWWYFEHSQISRTTMERELQAAMNDSDENVRMKAKSFGVRFKVGLSTSVLIQK